MIALRVLAGTAAIAGFGSLLGALVWMIVRPARSVPEVTSAPAPVGRVVDRTRRLGDGDDGREVTL